MAGDLDALRARSDELADRLEDDAALEANAQLLTLVPGDAKATLRLGAGLLAVGRIKDALDVYERGQEANRDNTMIANRVKQARHAAALGVKTAPSKRKGRKQKATPTAWLKSVYNDEDPDYEAGEETWISDAGQHDDEGERLYRTDGVAWGEPSWKVGDDVGLYFGGTYRVPVLAEVAELPRFDPAFVARERRSVEYGERWPWVTPVRIVNAVRLRDAPSLETLGIERSSMQQRARLVLDDEQRKRLLEALGA